MTSSLVASLNYSQKMCQQTRNSCTKAFDNRSRSKNLKPRKSRGVKASRVNRMISALIRRVYTSNRLKFMIKFEAIYKNVHEDNFANQIIV